MNKNFEEFDDSEMTKMIIEEFKRIEKTPMKLNYKKLEDKKYGNRNLIQFDLYDKIRV